MTSSRRHFVKIRSLSYLDNESSKINHIWYTSTSGQRSTKNVNKFCARTSTRAYARIKILKCSNSSQILFAHVSGHFKHFIKIAQNTHFCAFSFVAAKRKIIPQPELLTGYTLTFSEQFDTMFIFS